MSWIGRFPEACEAPAALFVFFLREGTPELPSPTFLPPLGEVSSFPHFGFKFLQCFLLFSSGHAILLISTRGYCSLQRDDIVQRVRPRVIFLLFPSLGVNKDWGVEGFLRRPRLRQQSFPLDQKHLPLELSAISRCFSGVCAAKWEFRMTAAVSSLCPLVSPLITLCLRAATSVGLDLLAGSPFVLAPFVLSRSAGWGDIALTFYFLIVGSTAPVLRSVSNIVTWHSGLFGCDYVSKAITVPINSVVESLWASFLINAKDIEEYRKMKTNSPWRNRPIEESLRLFDEMRRGMIEEGKATLLMKQDMQNDNCNISHDILMLVTNGASIRPTILPTALLTLSILQFTPHSLNYIVTNKHVDGWDDPRLLTLAGLRRRGVTPTAINGFVRGMGITRSDGTMIHMSRLEHHIREELNKTAPRAMVVGVKNEERIEISDESSKQVVTQRPNVRPARSQRSDRARAQARSLRSDRAIVPLGRYVATKLKPRLGRYVATELEPKLGRYVAIVPLGRHVATEFKPRLGRYVATELEPKLGRYVATELEPKLGHYVATGLEPKFSRCVAIEPFRTSIRHQSMHSRQTFECYLPKTVASSVHVFRYSNPSIKLRGLETAESSFFIEKNS
ncbi:hypothetical protein DY000_02051886 [Brassica cretica]|uniref:Glutamyl/glutaminyl-tRNA synthetase class Ib catalytic domain-containing protein n=1 Tax=Brassica cretica TaxID=69181 RepID=A0ABQ7AAS0_BRACR|nr:hypothetical protein DY000_02051886 [Brassica cretica]